MRAVAPPNRNPVTPLPHDGRMDIDAIRALVVAAGLDDAAACRAEIAAVRAVRGILDSREMAALARLDEIAATPAGRSSFPDADHAAASRSNPHAADKVRRRSKVAHDHPELGAALGDGDTTGERLDIVARATSGMSDTERARFATHDRRLRDAAREMSDRDFRLLVGRLAAQARTDDGADRLARQKRAVRLRWWTDGEGMWRLDGRFDPESGLAIDARLRRMVESLFHGHSATGGGIPHGAPTDPVERQQFLAAHALRRLADGRGAATSGPDDSVPASTGPDITVVIDATTFLEGRHEHTRLDVGLGLGECGLPVETIRRWACLGSVTPAIVGANGVRLLLGRERRLANRHQRRALRVLYATCALCDTAFDRCEIHHVHPWERGGSTDLENLLPLCSRHHHLVHEGGWILHLAPDRTLAVTRPGCPPSVHGPPTVRAA